MSEISPISQSNPALAKIAARRAAEAQQQATTQVQRGSDSVELSTTAQLLSQLKDVPDVREDLVNSVRAQIADGSYETEEKLDTTVEAILTDLA